MCLFILTTGEESKEGIFAWQKTLQVTKPLILTSVEILPQRGFTGFGLCFAEITGIQAYYYLDNCFARISSAILEELEGMSLTRDKREQLLLCPADTKCPVDTGWMGRRWQFIQFSFRLLTYNFSPPQKHSWHLYSHFLCNATFLIFIIYQKYLFSVFP